ncbi:UNKNOWN [Stylonychia lemnae]|uniref:Uncharacterized protein n=1 Tax=Stylonychia lemnae TaxID=5949 RepID=A0A077ZSQ0_STYLE|nr:UNKNOWN [Stylonychia lemnae]|eukprot:CDW72902.1 UNKNOWN [Stylonychia lemnae]
MEDQLVTIQALDQQIQIPVLVRLMSPALDQHLIKTPDEPYQLQDFPAKYISKAADYCRIFDYKKLDTTIEFPMASRKIEDNAQQYEVEFILPYINNFDDLITLFKLAKQMQIKALYELCAASIASYFRNRSFEDIKRELIYQGEFNANSQNQQQSFMILQQQYYLEEQKRRQQQLQQQQQVQPQQVPQDGELIKEN